jgi:hypothetical protein
MGRLNRELAVPGPAQFVATVAAFVRKTLVVAELEVRKFRHDMTEMVTRAVQSALWLLVRGEIFTRTHAIPTGNLPYLDFMAGEQSATLQKRQRREPAQCCTFGRGRHGEMQFDRTNH